jgi:hypothetical protein
MTWQLHPAYEEDGFYEKILYGRDLSPFFTEQKLKFASFLISLNEIVMM